MIIAVSGLVVVEEAEIGVDGRGPGAGQCSTQPPTMPRSAPYMKPRSTAVNHRDRRRNAVGERDHPVACASDWFCALDAGLWQFVV
jgi:hypothetical protein